ncbi:unnamed protein product, partial [Ixodes pacificus]
MYKFHYNVMKHGGGIKILYEDTDSLIYDIQIEDIYKDIKEMKKYFDTSDYPRDQELFSEDNKKVIGKCNDELNGSVLMKFVELRPKCHSYKKCVVQNDIHLDNYKGVFDNKKDVFINKNMIRKRNREIGIQTVTKKGLTFQDDKRVLLEDGISALEYGH